MNFLEQMQAMQESVKQMQVQIDKLMGDIESNTQAQKENEHANENRLEVIASYDEEINEHETEIVKLQAKKDKVNADIEKTKAENLLMEDKKNLLITCKEQLQASLNGASIAINMALEKDKEITELITAIKDCLRSGQPHDKILQTLERLEEPEGAEEDTTPTLRDEIGGADLEAVGT